MAQEPNVLEQALLPKVFMLTSRTDFGQSS